MLPTPTSSEDELLAAYYHEKYPGLTKDFLGFLKDVSRLEKEILPVARIISEHQSKFESKTVVYTRQELFAHLCSRGYTTQLATLLTKDADEEIIPHWTLSQWTVAFLSYASKSYASAVACVPESQNSIQKHPTSSPVPISRESTIKISNLKAQLEKVGEESSGLVLFHFTTRQSAASIESRIDVSFGRPLSEFSVRGAFYLTGSIEFGLRWLRTRHVTKKWVVLVYDIPHTVLPRYRCVRLEPPNSIQVWQEFCYGNFNEDEETLPQQQLEIDNDIIIGPICKFRTTLPWHLDHTSLKPFLDSNRKICIQYAVIKQPAADELRNYLTKAWDIVV